MAGTINLTVHGVDGNALLDSVNCSRELTLGDLVDRIVGTMGRTDRSLGFVTSDGIIVKGSRTDRIIDLVSADCVETDDGGLQCSLQAVHNPGGFYFSTDDDHAVDPVYSMRAKDYWNSATFPRQCDEVSIRLS